MTVAPAGGDGDVGSVFFELSLLPSCADDSCTKQVLSNRSINPYLKRCIDILGYHFEEKYLHQLNPYIQNITITGETSTHFGPIVPNYINNYVAKLKNPNNLGLPEVKFFTIYKHSDRLQRVPGKHCFSKFIHFCDGYMGN